MPTAPPSITTLPAAPDPSNRATFNLLAYPWSAALGTFTAQVTAVANNVKANADEAATAVTITIGHANNALTYQVNAKISADAAQVYSTSAGSFTSWAKGYSESAQTSATNASASAVAAAASAASIAGGPVASVNTLTGAVVLAKADIGLGNVDNTSNATERAATATLTNKTLTTPVLSGTASGTTAGSLGYASGALTYGDGTLQNEVGFRNIPQNSRSAAYTLVLGDAGKHILHPSADTTARTFTIPANASVAYPIGTALTFVNQTGAGVTTISITTDTMRLAGAGTTGSRTLAANGVATAIKLTATEWIISGTGLT